MLLPRAMTAFSQGHPLWPEPRYTTEASEAMRHHLQTHYDAKGLGPAPHPQGVASDVSPEHVAMLLEQKPEGSA
jgi:hypothetical protein